MTEGYRLSPDICVNNQDTNITCQVITVIFVHRGARKLSDLSQISDLKRKKTQTARADYLTLVGRKDLGKRHDPESRCPCDWAPKNLCADGRKFQKGKGHCSTLLGRQIASPQTSESSSKVWRNTQEGVWHCKKRNFLIWWTNDCMIVSIWLQF